MIKNHKNRYAMYDAVSAYLEENSSKFTDNEEFSAHFNSFKSLMNEIELKENQRVLATTGKVTNKNINRDSVTDMALGIAGVIYAYAKKEGNITLMESMKYNKGKFKAFRDTGLVINLTSIKEKALENSEAISRYGISAEKLEQFATKIAEYSNALGAKAAGGAEKSGASKSLKTLFKESGDILDSLDKIMESHKVNDRQFYDGYKSARVVKDLGVRHKDEKDENGGDANSGSNQVNPDQ